jgi:uncharacterized membrane protein
MAEFERQLDRYPDAYKIITIVVMVYLIVYVVAAWNPEITYFFFDTGEKGTQDGGKFGLLGTIGDFFGGVINPILTFITIYLLLVSIRIQREELEETREEMKKATEQATKSAIAAQESVIVAKISERPYIFVDKISLHKSSYTNEFAERDSLYLTVSNFGKTIAFIRRIQLIYIMSMGVREIILDDSNMIPIKHGATESLKSLQGALRLYNYNPSEWQDRASNIVRVNIEYTDFYTQSWSFSGDFEFLFENASTFKGELIGGAVYETPSD